MRNSFGGLGDTPEPYTQALLQTSSLISPGLSSWFSRFSLVEQDTKGALVIQLLREAEKAVLCGRVHGLGTHGFPAPSTSFVLTLVHLGPGILLGPYFVIATLTFLWYILEVINSP